MKIVITIEAEDIRSHDIAKDWTDAQVDSCVEWCRDRIIDAMGAYNIMTGQIVTGGVYRSLWAILNEADREAHEWVAADDSDTMVDCKDCFEVHTVSDGCNAEHI
jgi:hypothetical protein